MIVNIKNMEYTDLKNGDIVAMIGFDNEKRIIIVDRIEQSISGDYKLYTYAELDINTNFGEDLDLFLEKYEPGYSYNVKDWTFESVEEDEKIKLYNAIGKHFTEEYDVDWYNHFTDSSYFDIQDYLLDVFCIKVEEYDNDLIYPDFVNDIHRYIWIKCCEAVGMPDGFNEEPKEKMVSVDKIREWLEDNFSNFKMLKMTNVTFNQISIHLID
jgi:hypothetical protein